ncbi:unnamed protein product [Ixodes persulcatus]
MAWLLFLIIFFNFLRVFLSIPSFLVFDTPAATSSGFKKLREFIPHYVSLLIL